MYFITSVCKNRFPYFADADSAMHARHCLLDARMWPDASCHGWVLMPDHLHLLVVLGKYESLSLTIQRVKSLISKSINRANGFSQPIWQRGFHDHAIRTHEEISDFAQYLAQNPVKAGLVQDAKDYPYLWLTQGKKPYM
jgi:REP element-mobilizing transposase RayT